MSENRTAIEVGSAVSMAYERLRALVLSGDLPPGSRLAQAEFAEQLGTSTTPVREALRRLVGEGLVEFHPNRGFRTSDLGVAAMLRRLEVRLIVEPGIAVLAAERRTDDSLASMRNAIERERAATSAAMAHDASRDFHLLLAEATDNHEIVRMLDSLWITEVGRRLMTRRAADQEWQGADVIEHQAILKAVQDQRAEEARDLMATHIERALTHWRSSRSRVG